MTHLFEELQAKVFALYAQQRYADALDLLQASMVHLPGLTNRSRMEFWAACFECRLERPGEAMKRLKTLVEDGGWVGPRRLTTDGDLLSLHERQGWSELVAACEERRVNEQPFLEPEFSLPKPPP